jgi:TolB-like protein
MTRKLIKSVAMLSIVATSSFGYYYGGGYSPYYMQQIDPYYYGDPNYGRDYNDYYDNMPPMYNSYSPYQQMQYYQPHPQMQQVPGQRPSKHYSASRMNKVVRFLAQQLVKNSDVKNMDNGKMAVASFVDLEHYGKAGKLGKMLSENLVHDMQIRGFNVIDFKTMPTIEIGKGGDYVFSTDVNKLQRNHEINYVLSGTYTKYHDGVMVNARLLELKDKKVKSTAQAFIPNKDLKLILDVYDPEAMIHLSSSSKLSTVRVVSE